jgi:CHAD domain-containing protein
MAARIIAAYPVKLLRGQLMRLEDDVLPGCLPRVTPAAVHHLRTTIRRVEAQDKLLAQLRGLPAHRRESKELLKYLTKLRRLAGEVRDRDVEMKLVDAQSVPEIAADSKRVHRQLQLRRKDQAEELRDLIGQLREKVSQAAERLLAPLQSVEQLKIPDNELVELTERWFDGRFRAPTSYNQLHAMRKSAKLARYMLEAVPNSATAKKAAGNFEEIQRIGGEWHDWMQLTATAAEAIGKKHLLVKVYKRVRDAKLKLYRNKLAERRRHVSG